MFGRKTKKQLTELHSEVKALKEAAIPTGGQVDSDEHLYRSLTGSNRDLPAVTQDRMINIAAYLYDTNLMAGRMIEIVRDYVVGDGVTYTCKNEDVKAVLDDFWNDPINNWELFQDNACNELGIYGEQCWPVFVDENTGKVRLGYIDPGNIAKVITDPGNCKQPIGVKLKRKGGNKGAMLKVIIQGKDSDMLSEKAIEVREKFTDGECFLYQINKLTNATRGRSDLLRSADYLDGYDQMLFNVMERPAFLNNFIWDVELEGMDDGQIKEWLKGQKTPKPGSIRAHNEKVKWTAETPDLKGKDSEAVTNIVKNHILGGRGIPEHWYGSGANVNRASAAEMGDPTYKMLNRRRSYFKAIIMDLFTYVISKAIEKKNLKVKEEEAYKFQITMPDFVPKDVTKYSSAIQQIVQALSMAEGNGWLTRETVINILAIGIGQIGYKIDVQNEIDTATGDEFTDFEDIEKKEQAKALKEAVGEIFAANKNGGMTEEKITKITNRLIERLKD